jgi:Fic family protein
MEKPPYQITNKVLKLISEIQKNLGFLSGQTLSPLPLKLRKENQIRTIHHSLAIEGNLLTEEQITAILDKKKVLGPKKQILEVQNALKVYDRIHLTNPLKENEFLKIHQMLMTHLTERSGKYRKSAVGVFQGTKVSHIAPPAKIVPELMLNLFQYLNVSDDSWLIKACVFHYELEFIHPFEDGNGRMGRLWQQMLLSKESEFFYFLPIETEIHKNQSKYYKVLQECDKSGNSSAFIEFCLEMILQSMNEFLKDLKPRPLTHQERLALAQKKFKKTEFSRKDYLQLHPQVSTATASRDLEKGVQDQQLRRSGEKALAKYKFLK